MMERFETMDSKEKNIEGLKMEYAAIREEIILLMNEHNTHPLCFGVFTSFACNLVLIPSERSKGTENLCSVRYRHSRFYGSWPGEGEKVSVFLTCDFSFRRVFIVCHTFWLSF